MNRQFHLFAFRKYSTSQPSLTEVIAKLRNTTGLSLSLCKKAAKDSNIDYNMALDSLKKLATENVDASDKRGEQGLLGVRGNFKCLKLTRLRCESDFVAMNPEIVDLVAKSLGEENPSIQESVKYCCIKFKENIELSSEVFRADTNQILGHYIHSRLNLFVGKAVGIITLNCTSEFDGAAQNLANLLAKQLVACRTENLSISEFLKTEYFFDSVGSVQQLLDKFSEENHSKFKIVKLFSCSA